MQQHVLRVSLLETHQVRAHVSLKSRQMCGETPINWSTETIISTNQWCSALNWNRTFVHGDCYFSRSVQFLCMRTPFNTFSSKQNLESVQKKNEINAEWRKTLSINRKSTQNLYLERFLFLLLKWLLCILLRWFYFRLWLVA